MVFSALASIMGCLLVIVGIALLLAQVLQGPFSGGFSDLVRRLRGVALPSSFPGIIVISIGALLLAVGAATAT
jgi:hypothetical protein